MAHPIPDAALDDRLGIVGTTGSGKTYAAGTAIERTLSHKSRAVIVDPLGVWWGLRLVFNGTTPSPFDVVIFGGPHGDLPINEHAGALIGETVAGMAESAIIDLSQLGTKAAERRFMLAFLSALYRKASGDPVHLIFDEADMWAPERLLDKEGEAAKLLGMMETVVRRGRVKGFIPWLITQRPAVLSKNVLSMMDGLVAMKLTSTHDRDALGAWVAGQAEAGEWKRLHAELPTLPQGRGIVWLPSHGVLQRATFPTKATFDSSRTPKRGEKVKAAKLAPLDIPALRDRMDAVVAETKANDPALLKAEIARLKREAAKPVAPAVDPQATERAHSEGFDAGAEAGRAEGFAAGWRARDASVDHQRENLTRLLSDARVAVEGLTIPTPPEVLHAAPQVRHQPPKAVAQAPRRVAAPHHPPVGVEGEAMSKAERLILTALAQYPQGRTAVQVAVLTGYAANGGGFRNALGAIRSKGWAEGRGDLTITDAGTAALGSYDPLPHGDALLDHWRAQLGKAERSILDAVAEAYPAAVSISDVAAKAGYEANGGGFRNALGRLRTLELIAGRGEVRASEALFG